MSGLHQGRSGSAQGNAARDNIADVRELLFHVNNVFHTRVDLLLVAESIFFASIAALWNEPETLIKLTVSGLGTVMTLVLWYANATLKLRSDALARKLRPIDPVYDEYLRAAPLGATSLLTHVLPSVSFAAWVVVILRILDII
jgi:hypothetical protein